MHIHNTFCWVDIPVLDLDRAIHFYKAVLDMEVSKINEHGHEFGLFPHTDNSVAGCLTLMDRKPSHNGPLVYLNVEGRLDAAITAVKTHGKPVLKPKESIGPYGYRAVIEDSEGNAIALYSKTA